MGIQDILEKYETELKKFRYLLCPFIASEVITGFNIYEKQEQRPFPNASIVVSHLHAELDESKPYRLELEARIRNCCDTYEVQKVRFEKIDRHTAYKLCEGWEADEYYDSFGNRLTKKEVEDLLTAGRTIIGGGVQSDIRIALQSPEQLRTILEELRLYFNKYRIDGESGLLICDKDGRPELNPHAVLGSWEVPVVLVRSESELELGAVYPLISDVKIQKPEYFVSMIIHNNEGLLKGLLSQLSLHLEFAKVNANRLFVDYIDGNLQIKR